MELSESELQAGEASAAVNPASSPSGSPGRKEPILFEFVGPDSTSQFAVWMIAVCALTFGFGAYTWSGGLVRLGLGLAVLVGLRNSIVVKPSRVTITKKWFFVPYWRWTDHEIEDVWFDGDFGMDVNAKCIVVQLGRREVPLGSPKTMRQLFSGLSSLTAKARHSRTEQRLEAARTALKDGGP